MQVRRTKLLADLEVLSNSSRTRSAVQSNVDCIRTLTAVMDTASMSSLLRAQHGHVIPGRCSTRSFRKVYSGQRLRRSAAALCHAGMLLVAGLNLSCPQAVTLVPSGFDTL